MSRNRNSAFTLVELVLALLLGTILMAACLGVMRRCFTELAITNQFDSATMRTSMLVDQLRRDISNARFMQVGSNRFALQGYIHRDPATLVGTHLPARVVYEIRSNGGQWMLVRIQSESNGLDAAFTGPFTGPFIEPVYVGVAIMLVTSNQVVAIPSIDKLGLDENAQNERVDSKNDIPSMVQMVLLDQKGRKIFDHIFTRQRDGT